MTAESTARPLLNQRQPALMVRFSPLARLGGIFLTPLLRVPGICHAARACGGPWGRVVDPDGLLGKAPGAGPCEVVSVAAALRLAGWLLGWLPDRLIERCHFLRFDVSIPGRRLGMGSLRVRIACLRACMN